MKRERLALGTAILICTFPTGTLSAQTVHHAPGVYNIRDFALPGPGFFGGVYNYWYTSNGLKDASGRNLTSETVSGPGGRLSTTVNVNVNLDLYALAPTFIWVPKRKILGAYYGVMLAPTFANTSVGGALSRAQGTGLSTQKAQFNVADTLITPLWLSWPGQHYDVSYNYGFYIPTGKYGITTVNVPVVGPLRTSSADNTVLGFWENQHQGAFYLYPWADKRLAVQNTLTWELSRKKRGFDLTNGQYMTWNWGLSEMLPLKKDQSVLAEAGVAGYGSWQTTDDKGADASNPAVHDKVWAAGLQAGITIPKRLMAFNVRWMHEYSAVYRFQGNAYGLSFITKF